MAPSFFFIDTFVSIETGTVKIGTVSLVEVINILKRWPTVDEIIDLTEARKSQSRNINRRQLGATG